MVKIRKGQISDSKEIAKVNVNCWRSTYKGIMPINIINSHNYEKCEKGWVNYFKSRNDTSIMLVAVNNNNDIVGFCTGGQNREVNLRDKFEGELVAIYIEQKYQNIGIGKKLMLKFAQYLTDRKMTSMIICVLEKNISKGFYERLGGIKISDKAYQFGENKLSGIIYGWDNLNNFIEVYQNPL